ncbi:DUF99 family protein [Candidatus Woesearchaeota archaeon]|nr:DUF99 family protein [Candidatus Woesearchaeota archaeon]
MLKKQLRVLGLDDAPFNFGDRGVFVIGTFFRGGDFLDGVLSTMIEVDGEDATIKVIELVKKSRFKSQLQAILIDGIAFGGFNVINIQALAEKTNIPVIVVVRKIPDFQKLEKTLKRLDMEKKYRLMEKAGTPKELQVKDGKIFYQAAGISLEKAGEILRICCTRSYLPEPIRVAHLIGAGIVKGESKGRA